jgi:hypothetical protein
VEWRSRDSPEKQRVGIIGHDHGPSAMALTNNAGDVFCHAERRGPQRGSRVGVALRVCGPDVQVARRDLDVKSALQAGNTGNSGTGGRTRVNSPRWRSSRPRPPRLVKLYFAVLMV